MAKKHDGTRHLNQEGVDLPDLMNNGLPSTGMKEDAAWQGLIGEGAKRSTSDPMEVNFGDVALADALQRKYATPAQRFWTWILKFVPASVFAFLSMFLIWKPLPFNWIDLRPEVDKVEDFVFKLLISAAIWAFPIFWVVALTRRQKGTRRTGH
jgi:hypothetical protein